MNDNIGKQRLSHKQRLKNTILNFKRSIGIGLSGTRQIFQTYSINRWKRFVWILRSAIVVAFLCGITAAIDLLLLPYVHTSENENLKKILYPGKNSVFSTRYNSDFELVRKGIASNAGNNDFCTECIKPKASQSSLPAVSATAEKKVLLTFDDGPHPEYTPKVLDILKEENVPATFFIVGNSAEANLSLLNRIYEEGFEIGNHTFTHPNLAEVPLSRVHQELRATRRIIECITGRSTLLFRPPFSVNPPVEKIPFDKDGPFYHHIAETIDPRDWESGITADTIFNRVIRQEHSGVILLHDGGKSANRDATIEALPRIIKHFKSKGYKFITSAEYLGKTSDEIMPPLANDVDAALGVLNRYIIFNLPKESFFTRLLLLSLVVSIGRVIILCIMVILQQIKRKKEKPLIEKLALERAKPKVTIIVPAYNEEVTAVKTVSNLLHQTYPDYEILFVDDGSKDNTYEIVKKAFGEHPKVTVLSKPNGGKASALNYGIDHANGEFLINIDSDTQLKPDAIDELMKYFTNENIAAVAGNVKIGNEINMLTRWQSIEYITSQNFDKLAFDLLNCITVVPGALGAFRKSAILEVGKYNTDTLAEDCEITIRLLKKGYQIRFNPEAIALTEAPENMKMFMKQRFRWGFGTLQCFWKHRETAFNPKYKALGLMAYPNLLICLLIQPLFAPAIDVLTVVGIISGHGEVIAYYFAMGLIIESFSAVLAFIFEKEDMRKLIWIIPQRIIYRYFMLWNLVLSVVKALKGEFQSWGVLKRTGSVKPVEALIPPSTNKPL